MIQIRNKWSNFEKAQNIFQLAFQTQIIIKDSLQASIRFHQKYLTS